MNKEDVKNKNRSKFLSMKAVWRNQQFVNFEWSEAVMGAETGKRLNCDINCAKWDEAI